MYLMTEADEIWIETGKHVRYIPINDIAQSFGLLKSKILQIFFAFTVCDNTVSSFSGRGKKTAWDTLNALPEVLLDRCQTNQVHYTVTQLYHCWSYMSSFCTIGQVNQTMYMKLEK